MATSKSQKQKIELQAEPRAILGSKVKVLRRSGYLPAVLYGRGMNSLSLQIPLKDFSRVLKEAGESTLVYVNVDSQTYPTIIHDVARDPVSDSILHADFYKVRLDEKIKAMVPVVFEGESPAVAEQGGTFVRNINELEVEALPQDLPHEITIDISGMKNFGDQLLLKEIKLPQGVELTGNPDEVVATIKEPLSEEELKKMLEGEVKTVEEVEEIKPEKPEEGEVPAEEGAEPAPAQVEEPQKKE